METFCSCAYLIIISTNWVTIGYETVTLTNLSEQVTNMLPVPASMPAITHFQLRAGNFPRSIPITKTNVLKVGVRYEAMDPVPGTFKMAIQAGTVSSNIILRDIWKGITRDSLRESVNLSGTNLEFRTVRVIE